MAKSRQPKRPKRQPLRSCLGCGAKRPKRELVRVVRTPTGAIEIDLTGRKAGRGAYVCPGPDCLKAAVKGKKLERALEAPVPDLVVEELAQAVRKAAAGLVAAPPTGRAGRETVKG